MAIVLSDRNKQLLLSAPGSFELLILGMFIAPDHPMGQDPRAPQRPTPTAMQAIYQRNYTEAVYQLALFQPGREALEGQADIVAALEEVAARGLTAEAREYANGALVALGKKELYPHVADLERAKHIMLSYQVSSAPTHHSYSPTYGCVYN